MVERIFCKNEVVGSNPISLLDFFLFFTSWCNGSTIDFGSISIGSSPVEVTNVALVEISTRAFFVCIMKKFDYKRAFLNWLQLNGIYHIYFTNYYGGCRSTYNPRRFFTYEPPEFYISSAFSWIQTPEGLKYWGQKDLDWVSYVQNINKRI